MRARYPPRTRATTDYAGLAMTVVLLMYAASLPRIGERIHWRRCHRR
ncbi:MAG: hypothetical protein U5K43_14135 [Halofilum sp. (in: g-proteobacteria)]|nr:hypothetical protein [Halofilum sp. (in: g-proteobacteria)]